MAEFIGCKCRGDWAGGGRVTRVDDGLEAEREDEGGSTGRVVLGSGCAAAGLCPFRSKSMRLPEACFPLDAFSHVQVMLRRMQLSQGSL